jgi:hypothetical protein
MEAILKMRGLKEEEKIAQPIKCSICNSLNPAQEEYCSKCYRPLRIETIIEDQQVVNTTIAKLFKDYLATMQDPKQLKAYQEWLKTKEG